jgi:hypothetical protein
LQTKPLATRSTFGAITVQGGTGDDEIRIDQAQGAFTDNAITLDGRAGNDALVFDGSSVSEHMELRVNAGNDTVSWAPECPE